MARAPANGVTGELDTRECIDVVRQLAELGTREISLIGGEAFIRKDWLTIIRAIRDHGIDCMMQTGGYKLSASMLEDAVEAGLQGIGVSIDGLEHLHDRIRGVPGSYAEALRVLRESQRLGLVTSVNTHVGTETVPQLAGLLDVILDAGVRYWHVALTVPMGNAVDHDEILLQPYQLADVMPFWRSCISRGARTIFCCCRATISAISALMIRSGAVPTAATIRAVRPGRTSSDSKQTEP